MKSPSLPTPLKDPQTVAEMTSDAVLLTCHRNLHSDKEDWCVYNLLLFIVEEHFEDSSLVTKTQFMETALATEVFYVVRSPVGYTDYFPADTSILVTER